MSDQVFDDTDGQDSHGADIDAGFDNREGEPAPAGVAGAELTGDDPQTSHDADVAAGFEDDEES